MKQFLLVLTLIIAILQISNAQLSSIEFVNQIRTNDATLKVSSAINYNGSSTYNAGFDINFCISDNVIFTTGLRYFNSKYSLNLDAARWPSQHDENGGFDPSLPTGIQSQFIPLKSKGIEVPLLIGMNPIPKQRHFIIKAGVLVNYSLSDNFDEAFYTFPATSSVVPERSDYSWMGSASIEYGFNLFNNFSFKPFMEINLQVIQQKNSIHFFENERKHSYSFGFKLQYHLKNCYGVTDDI